MESAFMIKPMLFLFKTLRNNLKLCYKELLLKYIEYSIKQKYMYIRFINKLYFNH